MLHNVTHNRIFSPPGLIHVLRVAVVILSDCCMVLAGLIKHACHWWYVPPFHPACDCAAVPESALCMLSGWSSTVRTSMRCVSCVSPLHSTAGRIAGGGGGGGGGGSPKLKALARSPTDMTWTSSTPPHICIFVMRYLYHTDKRTATFAITQSGNLLRRQHQATEIHTTHIT